MRKGLERGYSRNQPTDKRLDVLGNRIVLVEYGPMRMVIHAFDHEKPLVDLAMEGGHLALHVFEDLVRFLQVVKRKAQAVEFDGDFPDVVRKMIEATKKMDEPDLTPLAAVAGAASDVVADFLIKQGGTKIIVDNGGDVAIRLQEGEMAKVGVKTEIYAKTSPLLLSIDFKMGIGGVATSGLGGRSFTKGIASAATVLSETASLADAAATVIGNYTNVDDPSIKRSLAKRIYPDTDIPDQWVTTGVGRLSRKKIQKALKNGLSKAQLLYQEGYIKGALVVVKGHLAWTDSLEPLLGN